MTFTLAGYRVERLLGQGSQGEVWLGQDESTGERVALKRIGLHSPDAADVARTEAALLARLDHPSLIALREFRICTDSFVLVLELAEAGSLANLLRRRDKLTPAEVVATVSPVAAALAHAHDAGVLHGDISPANILFSATGHPKLADLGVARLVAGVGAGAGLGTPAYLDPVIAAGGAAGLFSDVFSLAAVTLHALTGAGPWLSPGAEGASAERALAVAATGHIPQLQSRLAAVPPEMATVLLRALDPNPIRRGGAAEFALDIRAALPPVPVVLAGGRITAPVGRHSAEHRSSSQPAVSFHRPPDSSCHTPGASSSRSGSSSRAGSSLAPVSPAPPGSPRSRSRSGHPAAGSADSGCTEGDRSWLAADGSSPEFVPADLTRVSRPLIRPLPVPVPERVPAGPLRRFGQHLIGGSRLRAVAVLALLAILVAAGVLGWPLVRHRAAAATAGTSAVRQSPGTSAVRQSPGTSAVRQSPGTAPPAAGSGPVSAAQAGSLLARLDALRSAAFARRQAGLLSQVYASAELTTADTATLHRIVPAGCSLTGLQTSYRDLRILRQTAHEIALRVTASLPAGSLSCPGRPATSTTALGPQLLTVVLSAEHGRFLIARQSAG